MCSISFFCLGINYGFQVMRCVESTNVPFSIFKTRFKKGEICLVIACQALIYQIKIFELSANYIGKIYC